MRGLHSHPLRSLRRHPTQAPPRMPTPLISMAMASFVQFCIRPESDRKSTNLPNPAQSRTTGASLQPPAREARHPHPLAFLRKFSHHHIPQATTKGWVQMKRKITLKINGKPFTAEVEPRMLLIHYLREVAGFTGPHIGCETSICGACTVALDGKIVKSCTMFAVQADGREVVTIEGLASNGDLHPMQEAFWNQHGLQCGFCTPGMIMASRQLLERNPHPTDEEIRHSLDGNLCRCTGYQHIVNAVKEAADKAGA